VKPLAALAAAQPPVCRMLWAYEVDVRALIKAGERLEGEPAGNAPYLITRRTAILMLPVPGR
jgi:hypothetical protein